MGNEHKPYMACPECVGKGIRIGPVDRETRRREIKECQRCAGSGTLIFQGLRDGEPFYRAPHRSIKR